MNESDIHAVIETSASPRLFDVPVEQLAAQIVTALLTAKGGLSKYDDIVAQAIRIMRKDFTAELTRAREDGQRLASELQEARSEQARAGRRAAEEAAQRESLVRETQARQETALRQAREQHQAAQRQAQSQHDAALRQAQSQCEAAERELKQLRADAEAWRAHVARKDGDFVDALRQAAVRQRKSQPAAGPEARSAEDWLWQVAALSTTAAQTAGGDRAQYLDHIVACAAACLNWHAGESGTDWLTRRADAASGGASTGTVASRAKARRAQRAQARAQAARS